jgi:integrase
MRALGRLTALKVRALKEAGLYADGGNLYLQVKEGGTKSWIFRYQRARRDVWMGLGSVWALTLAQAREKARECRNLLANAIDPIEARDAKQQDAKLKAARAITFRACAEAYIAAHMPGWKNPKHREQWPATLNAYVYPVIGDLSASAVDTALVMKVLEPIWRAKPETANRVRGRIERVLDWARARGHRDRDKDNPARWRGHLENLLPLRSKLARVNHHAALPYSELPRFVSELRERDGIAPRALEFTILTVARTGEVIGARWPEIDFLAKTWTVPAARMKGNREHRVPLSPRVIEILSALPREGDDDGYVFIGARKGAGLSSMALLETLRRMGRDDLTVHGFRSTFRDWAAERTHYQNHVVEMALAHVVGDKVESAYLRSDMFAKRRRLADEWAKYCVRSTASKSGEVVLFGVGSSPIRGAT